jgi:hypothetical protein
MSWIETAFPWLLVIPSVLIGGFYLGLAVAALRDEH